MATRSGTLRAGLPARRSAGLAATVRAVRAALAGSGRERERKGLERARSLAELGRETGARC